MHLSAITNLYISHMQPVKGVTSRYIHMVTLESKLLKYVKYKCVWRYMNIQIKQIIPVSDDFVNFYLSLHFTIHVHVFITHVHVTAYL